MKYRPLFSIRIRHTYYTDGRCPDFTVEPAPQTTQLLKNRRCILKSTPDGIQVNIAVGQDDNPFIALNFDDTFVFRIRLANKDFALFTDLEDLGDISAPVYTNEDIPPENRGKLLLENRRAWGQETLKVASPAFRETFVVSGTPQAGSGAGDILINGIASINSPSKFEPDIKTITVDTRNAAAGDPFEIRYPVPTSLPTGVFAEIEVQNNYAVPGDFFIDFDAKQARWQYYLVAENGSNKDKDQFLVKDTGASAMAFGSEDLNENPDDWDAIAVSLRAQYPNLNLTRFETNDPVTLSQKTVTTLQLLRGKQQLISPLPNPALQNITHSTVSSKEAALYQVIKYVTSTNNSMGDQ
jgi:hypothetical protein